MRLFTLWLILATTHTYGSQTAQIRLNFLRDRLAMHQSKAKDNLKLQESLQGFAASLDVLAMEPVAKICNQKLLDKEIELGVLLRKHLRIKNRNIIVQNRNALASRVKEVMLSLVWAIDDQIDQTETEILAHLTDIEEALQGDTISLAELDILCKKIISAVGKILPKVRQSDILQILNLALPAVADLQNQEKNLPQDLACLKKQIADQKEALVAKIDIVGKNEKLPGAFKDEVRLFVQKIKHEAGLRQKWIYGYDTLQMTREDIVMACSYDAELVKAIYDPLLVRFMFLLREGAQKPSFGLESCAQLESLLKQANAIFSLVKKARLKDGLMYRLDKNMIAEEASLAHQKLSQILPALDYIEAQVQGSDLAQEVMQHTTPWRQEIKQLLHSSGLPSPLLSSQIQLAAQTNSFYMQVKHLENTMRLVQEKSLAGFDIAIKKWAELLPESERTKLDPILAYFATPRDHAILVSHPGFNKSQLTIDFVEEPLLLTTLLELGQILTSNKDTLIPALEAIELPEPSLMRFFEVLTHLDTFRKLRESYHNLFVSFHKAISLSGDDALKGNLEKLIDRWHRPQIHYPIVGIRNRGNTCDLGSAVKALALLPNSVFYPFGTEEGAEQAQFALKTKNLLWGLRHAMPEHEIEEAIGMYYKMMQEKTKPNLHQMEDAATHLQAILDALADNKPDAAAQAFGLEWVKVATIPKEATPNERKVTERSLHVQTTLFPQMRDVGSMIQASGWQGEVERLSSNHDLTFVHVLVKAPDILILQLVRPIEDKVYNPVTAPLELQLETLDKESILQMTQIDELEQAELPSRKHHYTFVGAILHQGNHERGHYTVMDGSRWREGIWVYHDDSKVRYLTEQHAREKVTVLGETLIYRRVKETY